MTDLNKNNGEGQVVRERFRWLVVWVFVCCFGWFGGCPAPIQFLEVSCEGMGCTASDGGERPESGSQVWREGMEKTEVFSETFPEPVVMESSIPEPVVMESLVEKKKIDAPLPCIDKDKDGYCANRVGPKGGVDCDDTDRRAFPGQTTYFPTARKRGGWDFNCNQKNDREPNPVYMCGTFANKCLIARAGVAQAVACGQSTKRVSACRVGSAAVCEPVVSTIVVVQKCR